MAKNKILRYARFYAGGVNISGSTRNVEKMAFLRDQNNLTCVGQQVNYYAAGKLEVGAQGVQALVDDTADVGTHAIMNGANTATRFSILLGSGAEPVQGDPAYSIPALQNGDVRSFDGGVSAIKADYPLDASQAVTAILSPWGVVLHPETSLSSTTNGASIDNGASSANGCHAIIHIVASDAGTWAFKVQHSTNDADWSDLITFSADGSAIGSEFGAATGTINQYIRFQATRTSGTVTPVVTFVRY